MERDRLAAAVKRLNLNLPAGRFEELQRFAHQNGLTMADTLRTALGVMMAAGREIGEGNRLVVASSNGDIVKEFVFPLISQEVDPVVPIVPSTLVDAGGRPLSISSPAYQSIITDVVSVGDELLHILKRDPSFFHQLTPRQFEEVVGELLTRQGYSVELTPFAKDGGLDIFVARKDPVGKFLYLVECKKYSPGHPVGVEVVRDLYGVVEQARATAGILATTSVFTSPAREWQRSIENRMALHDFYGLKEWLKSTLGAKPGKLR
jgi:hypothetical protein